MRSKNVHELLTWLFLGLALPQLGVEQDALTRARYFKTHRSVGQDRRDVIYTRFVKASELGSVSVVVVTRSQKVTALVLTSRNAQAQLDGLVAKDDRCSRRSRIRFVCRLGGSASEVDVAVCAPFIILYSKDVAVSRAHALSLC